MNLLSILKKLNCMSFCFRILFFLGSQLTAMVFTEERKEGILERYFVSGNLKRTNLNFVVSLKILFSRCASVWSFSFPRRLQIHIIFYTDFNCVHRGLLCFESKCQRKQIQHSAFVWGLTFKLRICDHDAIIFCDDTLRKNRNLGWMRADYRSINSCKEFLVKL